MKVNKADACMLKGISRGDRELSETGENANTRNRLIANLEKII